MPTQPDTSDAPCPSGELLALVGGKWSMMIICTLQPGPMRTGTMMRVIRGISPKMLTKTLRELQHNGLVDRKSYGEVPPRVEYSLSPLGQSLSELTLAMEHWITKNLVAVIEHRKRVTG